jgi:streptomycin 6-kinase
MMHLPANLEAGLATWTGETARRWLSDLPRLIAAAEERWEIAIGGPFEPGGATSYVAPAVASDGRRLVYKCTIPHDEAIGEADALRAYNGDGAVRLHADRSTTFELLVERCEPGSSLWDEPDDVRMEVTCTLMKRLWRSEAVGRFATLRDLTSRWAGITERRMITLEVPWITGPIERGVDLLTSLPTSAPSDVLLHQDLHPGNILSSTREPWLVIDPKPVVGDAAFDPVQLLVQDKGRVTEPPGPDSVSERLERIGALLALDPERVGLWALARCAEWSMWSFDRGRTIDAAIEYTWARTLDVILPG